MIGATRSRGAHIHARGEVAEKSVITLAHNKLIDSFANKQCSDNFGGRFAGVTVQADSTVTAARRYSKLTRLRLIPPQT